MRLLTLILGLLFADTASGQARPDIVLIISDYMGYGDIGHLSDDSTLMLFDLETDIGERDNLAYRHPEKLRELYNALVTWENGLLQ